MKTGLHSKTKKSHFWIYSKSSSRGLCKIADKVQAVEENINSLQLVVSNKLVVSNSTCNRKIKHILDAKFSDCGQQCHHKHKQKQLIKVNTKCLHKLGDSLDGIPKKDPLRHYLDK